MPMLDETQEYKEYTMAGAGGRITKQDMKDSTYGRPLVIVARQYIFEELNHCPEEPITGADVERTKEILRRWLKEYLPEHIKKIYDKETDEDKQNKSIKKIPDLDKPRKSPTGNDINRLTYESIISDALEQGPLKRYYLVAARIEDTVGVTAPEFFSRLGLAVRPEMRNQKTLNSVLKILSAFLIGRIGSNKWCLLRQSDIDRWKGIRTDFWKKYAAEIMFDGERLMDKDNFLDNNQKVYINPVWIEQCGWCITDDAGLDALLRSKPNILFFSDSGKDLEKGIRYGN